MISRSYQQYCIVQGDTAQALTDQLNAKLIELNGKQPTVTFEGLIARIQYTESEEVPESLADEYQLQGVRLRCEDCPMFVPMLKADGTEDHRAKKGGCPLSEFKYTWRDSMACDILFQMINEGRIELCLKSIK